MSPATLIREEPLFQEWTSPAVHLVIAASSRLARELRQTYDKAQVAAGRATWTAPEILPFSAWMDQCWREWLYSGNAASPVQLLRPSQERAIWEDIIGGSDEGRELLLGAATADAAWDAWNLMCAWQLPLDGSEWDDSRDTEAFSRWAREFRRRCATRNWLSGGLLAQFVADRFDDDAIPVPDHIVLAGFNEFTPAQESLLATLRRKGCRVEASPGPRKTRVRGAVRVGFVDTHAEIRAAARWAKRLIENRSMDSASGAGPERPIAIIVPDLSRYRSQIERVFAEELHPNGQLSPDRDPQRAFNISLGPALLDYSLIHAAFLVLHMRPSAIPLEDVSRLWRSPFINGGQTEYTRRALLDARLRQLREPEVSAADLVAVARTMSPMLVGCFARWESEWERLPARQMPSDWAASFSRLLNAIGWPGDRPMSSPEYQTMTAWNDMLAEFASLDSAAGNLHRGSALAMLQRLAASRQFQPESEPAPIQILGVFEASGLEFDHLWIMGMHDAAWPKSTNPNPFLPLRLQREKNMPQSSPQRELEFTRLLTEQLLASAPSVVVSYPRREADSDLRPSALFLPLPDVREGEIGLAAPSRFKEMILLSSTMELMDDQVAPPWNGRLRRGGAAIFSHQAACPFRAFAQLRLGAEALDSAEPGLSALDRGILIHAVLERVWNELQSHQGLTAIDPDGLESAVMRAVQESVDEMALKKRALRQSRFAAIERARLRKIVIEWLELEKQRQPFTVLHQEEERQVVAGGVALTIRADRVDRLDDGALILIDYKSGEHGPAEWDGDRPDEPQLPLYAVTAEEEFSGIFFGVVKSGKTRFSGLTSSEGVVPKVNPRAKGIPLSQHIANWRVVLEQSAADFRDGKAIVDPKNPNKTCAHCCLPALCRIGDADGAGSVSSEDGRA